MSFSIILLPYLSLLNEYGVQSKYTSRYKFTTMGKKSKRNRGGKGKDRVRGAERRSNDFLRWDEESDTPQLYGGNPREFLHGDFVRYCDPEERHNASVRRGIIEKHDGDGLSANQFKFIALDDDAIFNKKIGSRVVDVKDIYPDIRFTALRFSEGDTVIYRHPDGFWIKCVIFKVFPRPTYNIDNSSIDTYDYPFYVCEICTNKRTFWVYDDLETTIRKYVRDSCSRFNIGDDVLINPESMEKISRNMISSKKHWIKGKIEDVFSTEDDEVLAGYECSFTFRGKYFSRSIFVDDTSENIVSLTADPLTRLMDAIDQDCSFNHFSYLVKYFDIDFSDIKALFVDRALESASYNALLWAQKIMKVFVFKNSLSSHHNKLDQQIYDDNLRKLAKSQNLIRFLRKAIDIEKDKMRV